MIYTKPISEITWQDVTDFCAQRPPEGTFLDYKEAFPAQPEKTIAAMANTFGGVVLIGVEEDDENKPILPLKGVALQRGLSERVMGIVLSNVSPPLIPEVHVAADASETNAVVIIRIPQSHQSPHAVSGGKAVYLRTGDRNNPEELATVSEIGWLTGQRARSTALREDLYRRAEGHFSAFYNRVLAYLHSRRLEARFPTTGILTISIVPTFPKPAYKLPSQLAEVFQRIRVPDYYRTDRSFPSLDTLSATGTGTIVQDGFVVVNYTDNADRLLYSELSSFGLFFYRQPLRREPATHLGRSCEMLRGGELLARIDESIQSATRLYPELGYWGPLDFATRLGSILETGLYLDWFNTAFPFDAPHGFSPDEEVLYKTTIASQELEAERERILLESASRVCSAFGIDFAHEHIQVFDQRIRR